MQTLRTAHFTIGFGLLLAATGCTTPADSDEGQDQAALSAERCSEGCTNTGTFALRAKGTGLQTLAGRKVAIAAVEPTVGSGPHDTQKPAAMLVDRVGADGRFQLTCARALSVNYYYPSYGLWIDKDGDGKCGAGDLAVVNANFYGWVEDQSITTGPAGMDAPETWLEPIPWTDAATAESWGQPFCAYFGFPR